MSSLRILIAGGGPEDEALAMPELRREWPAVAFGELDLHAEGDAPETWPDLLLVVCDVELGDSLDVLRRARERWPDLPVVMLAGTAFEEAGVEAIQRGFDGHV
jgi:DNA-binding response OmpR family regulator